MPVANDLKSREATINTLFHDVRGQVIRRYMRRMNPQTHLKYRFDPTGVLFKPAAISIDALVEIHRFMLVELKRLVEN